jgi:NAD(P)-dependent dehydrogenase (short-subunit alcohol dehydrogenase family)
VELILQRILITGAARRLGAIMVRALAHSDRMIIIQTFHSSDEALQLAADLSSEGKPVVVVKANLADDAEVRDLVSKASAAAGGPITDLVNNASVLDYDAPGQFDGAVFDEAMRINLKVPLMLADSLVAQLPTADLSDRTSQIVNILDQKLWNLNPDFYSYTCSKAGLQAATHMLAQALAPRVVVNAIAPGPVLMSFDQSPEDFDRMAALNPLARPIDPDEIGKAIAFLFEASAYTGQILHVDNGQRLLKSARDLVFATRQ